MFDPTQREISSLNSSIRPGATWLIWVLRTYYTLPAIVSDGRRTSGEQATLYAKGRTRPGPIVTNAKFSDHQIGLAFDIDMLGHPPADVPESIWSLAGAWGEYLGLAWGGRFLTISDQRHFFLSTV